MAENQQQGLDPMNEGMHTTTEAELNERLAKERAAAMPKIRRRVITIFSIIGILILGEVILLVWYPNSSGALRSLGVIGWVGTALIAAGGLVARRMRRK